MEGAPPKAFSLMMERRRVKRLAVPEDAIEGDASATPNAFSLMMERWRVKHPAEREDATEYDASATLSRTLEDYGLPPVELQKGRVRGLKTKVPSSEAAESAAYLFDPPRPSVSTRTPPRDRRARARQSAYLLLLFYIGFILLLRNRVRARGRGLCFFE